MGSSRLVLFGLAMPWNRFFFLDSDTDTNYIQFALYLIHAIIRSNDNNCHCFVIQTRGVCMLWTGHGPDDHTSHLWSTIQFLITKSSSLLHMSLHTPSTHMCFLGCELYRLHEWEATWFPATKQYTWTTRGELYELFIAITLTCMFDRCQLCFIAYLRLFSGCELYGLQMS